MLMFIMQRDVIIALAVVGALLAIIGNFLDVKGLLIEHKSAQFIRKSGYAVTWLSIAFFIVAGFFQ